MRDILASGCQKKFADLVVAVKTLIDMKFRVPICLRVAVVVPKQILDRDSLATVNVVFKQWLTTVRALVAVLLGLWHVHPPWLQSSQLKKRR